MVRAATAAIFHCHPEHNNIVGGGSKRKSPSFLVRVTRFCLPLAEKVQGEGYLSPDMFIAPQWHTEKQEAFDFC